MLSTDNLHYTNDFIVDEKKIVDLNLLSDAGITKKDYKRNVLLTGNNLFFLLKKKREITFPFKNV